MIRYWTIWPYHPDDPQTLDKAWRYDLENGAIAIGWQECGDVANLTRAELEGRVQQAYPDEPAAASMLWRFFHDVQPGDKVVAVRSRREFVGVGTVLEKAFHDEQRGRERVGLHRDFKPNFIRVAWQLRGSFKLSSPALPRQTIAEITQGTYAKYTQGVVRSAN